MLADNIESMAPPTDTELAVLRALNARTKEAHSRPIEVPA
jgi:glutaconate CoA-transferase subunit B